MVFDGFSKFILFWLKNSAIWQQIPVPWSFLLLSTPQTFPCEDLYRFGWNFEQKCHCALQVCIYIREPNLLKYNFKKLMNLPGYIHKMIFDIHSFTFWILSLKRSSSKFQPTKNIFNIEYIYSFRKRIYI